MKRLIFLIGAAAAVLTILPAIADAQCCGEAGAGYFIARQSGQDGQGGSQSQPMTRSQDWPNVQGSGPPYGTSTQKSETPGYPLKQSEGDNIAAPQAPAKGQRGGDMGAGGSGTPYGTPSRKSATPGFPPEKSEGDNIATPGGPGRQSGNIAPGGAGTPYGTPSRQSTTPGYPRPQQEEGIPYGSPTTPEQQRPQGGQ